MSMQVWWWFLGVTFLVSATPGPNMLLVMSTSVQHGLRGALATMAGCLSGVLAMMCLSAAGLGALLQAFPAVFDTLRWCGAAYLGWLGIRSWRAPVPASPAQGAAAPQPGGPRSATLSTPAQAGLFRRGLWVALSNPKAILFAAALLPQFVRADQPKLPQFAVLLATFAVVETGWYLVYAGSGRQLATLLQQAAVIRLFNRLTGGVFLGFAAWMAVSRG